MAEQNVVIVGGGPVGLATALGLARRGVEVALLEQGEQIGVSSRALGYFSPVLDGFAELGVLDDIERAGSRVEAQTFVDFETRERIVLDMTPLEGIVERPYNITLGQHRISEILLAHLRQARGVTILRGTRAATIAQDATGVTITAQGPDGPLELRAGWLIGADGANSVVRKALGLGFDGFTWPERFIATNIRYDFESAGYDQVNLLVHHEFGAIVVRIERDLWRYTYGEAECLPIEGVLDRLARRMAVALQAGPAPGAPGEKEYELVQYSPYRMHQRAAEHFRMGRVLLAGDAAHITNPTAGLGLTSGFLDAFVLTEALAAVVAGDRDDSVLDAYAEARRRVFLDIVSPISCHYKHLVFGLEDPSARAQALDALRALAADKDRRREQLLHLRSIVTPSLVRSAGGRR